jgi:hypothetical protein
MELQENAKEIISGVKENIELARETTNGLTICTDCATAQVLKHFGLEHLQGVIIGLCIASSLHLSEESDAMILGILAHCFDLESNVLDSDVLEVK